MVEPVAATAVVEFDAALSRVERALAAASKSLLSHASAPMEPAFQLLQQTLRECVSLDTTGARTDKHIQQRLRLLGAGLEQLHQAVARSGAVVQKQLQTLLPSQGLTTYGRQAGAYGRGKTAAAHTSMTA